MADVPAAPGRCAAALTDAGHSQGRSLDRAVGGGDADGRRHRDVLRRGSAAIPTLLLHRWIPRRDFVTSPSQALAFFVGSLLTDAAVVGVIVWAALWLLGRLAVPRPLALGAAWCWRSSPCCVADFVEYQLLTYLGDAFDLRLLFDLAGREPGRDSSRSHPRT